MSGCRGNFDGPHGPYKSSVHDSGRSLYLNCCCCKLQTQKIHLFAIYKTYIPSKTLEILHFCYMADIYALRVHRHWKNSVLKGLPIRRYHCVPRYVYRCPWDRRNVLSLYLSHSCFVPCYSGEINTPKYNFEASSKCVVNTAGIATCPAQDGY